MKKKVFLCICLTAVFFTACSNDDDVSVVPNLKEDTMPKSDVINISPDGTIPDSIYQLIKEQNPELYEFENPNSQLWVNESNNKLKTAGVTIKIHGYDETKELKTEKWSFPQGLLSDFRVPKTTTIYLGTLTHYYKYFTVPKNASPVLPPTNIMATMTNMGRMPNGTMKPATDVIGYAFKYVSTSSAGDKYALVTEAIAITHNISGQHVFSPPVFMREM